jgi:hypothetical protein
MMDLNSLVDLPPGVGLVGVTAINDAGQPDRSRVDRPYPRA